MSRERNIKKEDINHLAGPISATVRSGNNNDDGEFDVLFFFISRRTVIFSGEFRALPLYFPFLMAGRLREGIINGSGISSVGGGFDS